MLTFFKVVFYGGLFCAVGFVLGFVHLRYDGRPPSEVLDVVGLSRDDCVFRSAPTPESDYLGTSDRWVNPTDGRLGVVYVLGGTPNWLHVVRGDFEGWAPRDCFTATEAL